MCKALIHSTAGVPKRILLGILSQRSQVEREHIVCWARNQGSTPNFSQDVLTLSNAIFYVDVECLIILYFTRARIVYVVHHQANRKYPPAGNSMAKVARR